MEPARLEFTDSSGNPRVVSLEQSPFRIGRSTSNDLSLASAEVSREHARIEWEDDRYVLRDNKSRAGTFVNGDPVEEHSLEPGDRIRVGPTLELVFAVGPVAAAHDDQTSSTSTAITGLRQTATLLEGLRALGGARVLDHVLDLVLDSAIDVSGAERGFLMLVSKSGTLEFKSGRRRDKQSLSIAQFQTSRKIPEEVFRTGEIKLIDDLFDSPNAADHEGTIALGIRNVLCAPLTTIQYVENEQAAEADRRIGVLYLDSRERQSFKSTTLRVAMETLANEAAGAIQNARLYRESQEKAKLEQDLQTAHEFQQALLPRSAPDLGFFRAAASMVPCRMIGGDFFEYVRLDNGGFGFTLGDVAGKGAPAGLLGARIQEIFAAHAPTLVEPATTIDRINSTLLNKSLESRFVTMVYGVLYPDGTLCYCNAGHNPPVLMTAGGVRRLETGGLIVGLFDDAEFEEETLQMAKGDLLVLFSDGISEANNVDGEEFGDNGIIASVGRQAEDVEPAVVLTQLFADLHTFTGDELQGDDMTGLILRYDG
jgi:serine phosphatase RsbU (regulator of sigma subunit)